jgi:hypothetical protein
MRCTTERSGSQKKAYCFLHLSYAVCRNLIDHHQAHLQFLHSTAVSKGSSIIKVLLLVLTMFKVIFVDCIQTARSVAWNFQNAFPWTLSIWNTGSVRSHSCRGPRWIALIGLGLDIPSTFTGTQLEVRARVKARAEWTDFKIFASHI